MRILGIAALCAALGGCVTAETVQFKASPQQQSMVRDGQPALISRQKSSVVLVRPASRQLQAGGRPVFVVGINNLSKTPSEFRVAQVEAFQVANDQQFPMTIVTYEMLVQEEKSRQVAAAILTGVAAGANAYSASRAGYGNFSATTTGPRGTAVTHGSFYSPTAAAVAQGNAAAQNEAMISATIESGQANMAALEQNVLKDNTLMPGEWVGGQLHLSPPVTPPSGNSKNYTIIIMVGSDRHVVEVTQSPAGA
jgi:hypothetical protein